MCLFSLKKTGKEFILNIYRPPWLVKPPTSRMMIMPQALLTARLCPRGAEVWGSCFFFVKKNMVSP